LPKRAALLGIAVLPYAFVSVQLSPPQRVSFSRDVAPVFRAHCISCHSGAAPAGGLELSSAKGILRGGTSGSLFTNGLLMKRLTGAVGPQMPMGMPPLAAPDLSAIKAWADQNGPIDGDPSKKHWSYVAPVRVAVPSIISTWIRNPIDAFTFQKMKQEGLHPSPAASKETLIRRVTLDLIGLPPTPAEVEAFLADKSPNAYERVVDRLLRSPHYGERQARGWLDLARYADTDGYEKDLNRTAWLYRDWVIDAFNQNLPYNAFTIDQLAGDLLPNANLQDKVATGFCRNTMQNLEGGVDQEEAHFAVILDRSETAATTWLGTTIGCCRCHDHKYDPFTQRDYYKMAAFFSNTKVIPRGPKSVGEEKWLEPELQVPTEEQKQQEAALSAKIIQLTQQVNAPSFALESGYRDWVAHVGDPTTWQPATVSAVRSAGGAKFTSNPDGSETATGPLLDKDTYTIDLGKAGANWNALRLDVLPDASLGSHGPGRADNGNFVLTGIRLVVDGQPFPLVYAMADYSQPMYDASQAISGGDDSGWAINGQNGKPHYLVATLAQPVKTGQTLQLILAQNSQFAKHVIGRFRISMAAGGDPFAELIPNDIRSAVAAAGRSAAQEKLLTAFYRKITPILAPIRAELASDQAKLASLRSHEPTAMVLEENPAKGPLTAYVRSRGQFLSKTEEVTAGTPAILPQLPAGRADRLALARWIVSKSNPLTARVEVNRMWELYFGRGIVETSEDFGTRCSPPTHPELLDWMACKFMDLNWDMKAMNRLIVTSATYRQSSDATPALIAKDPQNLYLARAPRFRMEAEMIHDNALAAAGLLSSKIGGPSVFPSQPDGIWDSPYSGQQWMPSKGEDRYRRGIYTFWKRTAPYPSFMALDATSREACTVRRIRTNTPLQALALLNDSLMIQAAQGLAKEMMTTKGAEPTKVAAGFERCTARRPDPAELNRLEALLAKLRAKYEQRPNAAAALGGTAERAAYTMVANVMLNLDETITKG